MKERFFLTQMMKLYTKKGSVQSMNTAFLLFNSDLSDNNYFRMETI